MKITHKHKNIFGILVEKSILTSCFGDSAIEVMMLLKEIVGERN